MTKAAPPPSQPEDERLKELAIALADMRDSWVNLSLILKDLATELPTLQRDEVAMEVERYLARLQPRWPLKVLHLWPVKLLHPGPRKLMC